MGSVTYIHIRNVLREAEEFPPAGDWGRGKTDYQKKIQFTNQRLKISEIIYMYICIIYVIESVF